MKVDTELPDCASKAGVDMCSNIGYVRQTSTVVASFNILQVASCSYKPHNFH